MNPGTFLFDNEFTFHDNNQAPKILVVLGSGKGLTVVVKTTSKGHRYSNNYGCQAKNRFSAFYLPKDSCCLKEPTWVCLHEFYELRDTVLLQRHFSGKVRRIGCLPLDITEQLLECALECDDITIAQTELVAMARKNLEKMKE